MEESHSISSTNTTDELKENVNGREPKPDFGISYCHDQDDKEISTKPREGRDLLAHSHSPKINQQNEVNRLRVRI